MVAHKTIVLRGGVRKVRIGCFIVSVSIDAPCQPLDAVNLVVGDIVDIKLGDRVPADVRVIKSDDMKVARPHWQRVSQSIRSTIRRSRVSRSLKRAAPSAQMIIQWRRAILLSLRPWLSRARAWVLSFGTVDLWATVRTDALALGTTRSLVALLA